MGPTGKEFDDVSPSLSRVRGLLGYEEITESLTALLIYSPQTMFKRFFSLGFQPFISLSPNFYALAAAVCYIIIMMTGEPNLDFSSGEAYASDRDSFPR